MGGLQESEKPTKGVQVLTKSAWKNSMLTGQNTCTNFGTGWHQGVIFHRQSKKLRYPRKTGESGKLGYPNDQRQDGANGCERLP